MGWFFERLSGCEKVLHLWIAARRDQGKRAVRRRLHVRLNRLESLEERTLLSIAGPEIDEDPLGWSSGLTAAPGQITQAQVDEVLSTLTTTGSHYEYDQLQGTRIDRGSEPDDPPQTAESTGVINLDAFRADPRFSGIDGSGFACVILDTGIDLDHPFFGSRIVYSYDFYDSNDSDASDFNGHGSNVSSIVAGYESGVYTGMAPGADIIHLKVFPDGDGGAPVADQEEALQWVVANAAAYNIVSVNMSLGGGNYDFLVHANDRHDEFMGLAALDIVTAVAAGNSFYSEGSVQGVGYPAADPFTLAVGATFDADIGYREWDDGTIAYTTDTDRIVPFSQRDDEILDIMAPGALITGADWDGTTVSYTGTSQASPHIAGIAALMQELAVQELGRRLTQDEYRELLQQTAVTVIDGDDEDDNVTNTGLSFPRVDVLALGEAILDMTSGSISGEKFEDLNGDGNKTGDLPLPNWTIYLDDNNNDSLESGTGTYNSTDTPVTIVDKETVYSNRSLSGIPGLISDVDVTLNISHTWDEDLGVYLVAPSGTRVELFTGVGSSFDNFTNTELDDEAATPITSGGAPFSGSWQPEGFLSDFDGQDPNGTWTLEISDNFAGDQGALTSWSLDISYAEESDLTDGSGDYSFGNLLAGTYTVREVQQAGYTQTAPALGYHSVSLTAGQDVIDQDFGNQADAPDLDYGDAPDPSYPTLAASDGARHTIVPGGPLMGALVDSDPNGQQDPNALGDDNDGTDDEDGVTFTSQLLIGYNAEVDVDMTASPAGGLLNAWIDFNDDGDWDDTGEQIFTNKSLTAGTVHTLRYTLPKTATAGSTFARFRLDSAGGLSPRGQADDGEVEDYEVQIKEVPTIDVGENVLLPDTAGQLVDVFVASIVDVKGLVTNVQVADGYPDVPGSSIDGPNITDVDLVGPGTVFGGVPNFGNGIIASYEQIWIVQTGTTSGTVQADGLLARLELSTVGWNETDGPWDLKLRDTFNDHTNFQVEGPAGSVVANTINGSIRIDKLPVPVILPDPLEVNEGGSIILDGTTSYDPDPGDTIVLYEWDLHDDDVFETTGPTALFSAADLDGPTSPFIGLRVTDNHGGQGTIRDSVDVFNVAPVVDAGPNQTADEGETIVLAPATFTDAGIPDTHTAMINWGDGTPAFTRFRSWYPETRTCRVWSSMSRLPTAIQMFREARSTVRILWASI